MEAELKKIRHQSAVERLLRDYKEIMDNQIPTLHAQPLDNNIFVWHANLIGPPMTDYEGGCFHLMMEFPQDYPMKPPRVRLLTTVHRDHVFGEWICLDMLQSWGGFQIKKYRGWSTAYTASSILLQLQAFIFEPEAENWFSNIANIKRDCLDAATYKCSQCEHDMKKGMPFPWADHMQLPLTVEQTEARFGTSFKRQSDVEQEIDDRNKELRKNQKTSGAYRAYENEARERAQKMKMEVMENRMKLARKMEREAKLKFERNMAEIEEQKLTEVVKRKEKKFKINNEDDAKLNVIWHTRLNPFASAFVPKSIPKVDVLPETKPAPLVLQQTPEHQSTETQSVFDMLPTEILVMLFTYLPSRMDIERLSKVCILWRRLVLNTFIIEKRETICFHSKKTWEDDVLGVGVSPEKHSKTGEVQYITSRIDLISHGSFHKEQVRQSVWQEPFTHWLPLYINRSHGNRAMPLFKKAVSQICGKPFHPWLAVDILAKLMNTMVVSVMDGNLHASIVALQGYCYFHRLLIALTEEYPELTDMVNQKIIDFLSYEENRHKRETPSLGDFLPLLSISKFTWANVAVPVVRETMTRNVLWISKKHPALAVTDQVDTITSRDENRASSSFESSKTSLRLIMFHVYFVTSVAKVGKISKEEIAKGYDMRYGRPTERQQTLLQKNIFRIQNVDNYKMFFQRIKLPVPSDEHITVILKECVVDSARKRYHRYSATPFNPRDKDANKKPQQNNKPRRAHLNSDDLDY